MSHRLTRTRKGRTFIKSTRTTRQRSAEFKTGEVRQETTKRSSPFLSWFKRPAEQQRTVEKADREKATLVSVRLTSHSHTASSSSEVGNDHNDEDKRKVEEGSEVVVSSDSEDFSGAESDSSLRVSTTSTQSDSSSLKISTTSSTASDVGTKASAWVAASKENNPANKPAPRKAIKKNVPAQKARALLQEGVDAAKALKLATRPKKQTDGSRDQSGNTDEPADEAMSQQAVKVRTKAAAKAAAKAAEKAAEKARMKRISEAIAACVGERARKNLGMKESVLLLEDLARGIIPGDKSAAVDELKIDLGITQARGRDKQREPMIKRMQQSLNIKVALQPYAQGVLACREEIKEHIGALDRLANSLPEKLRQEFLDSGYPDPGRWLYVLFDLKSRYVKLQARPGCPAMLVDGYNKERDQWNIQQKLIESVSMDELIAARSYVLGWEVVRSKRLHESEDSED